MVEPEHGADSGSVTFDEFSIDTAALELRRGGIRVELSPQAVRLLSFLVSRRGELLTREELYAAMWPGAPEVDVDRGLNTLIRQIRRALDDSVTDPRYIRTYPRRGYRFQLPPSDALSGAAQRNAAPSLVKRAGHGTWRNALLAIGLAVAAAVVARRERSPDATVPQSARESFELGRYVLQSPDVSRRAAAVPHLVEAARLAPNSARVQAHLADALLWGGRGADADSVARFAVALDPREPHALFIRGVLVLIREWDWTRSEQLLRDAIARDPSHPLYPVVLAFVLSTAGRRRDAVRLLDRAMMRGPASAILTADIGVMYLYSGLPRQAARACEQAARLVPREVYSLECALAARVALGHLDSARAHAAALVARAGGDAGTVLGTAGVPADTALRRYWRWRAERARGRLSDAPFGVALALAEAGRAAEAVRALEIAAANKAMGFVTITVDPRLAPLHRDPSFLRLAAPLVRRGAAPPNT